MESIVSEWHEAQGKPKFGFAMLELYGDDFIQTGRAEDRQEFFPFDQVKTRYQAHQAIEVISVEVGDKNEIYPGEFQFELAELDLGAFATVQE